MIATPAEQAALAYELHLICVRLHIASEVVTKNNAAVLAQMRRECRRMNAIFAILHRAQPVMTAGAR